MDWLGLCGFRAAIQIMRMCMYNSGFARRGRQDKGHDVMLLRIPVYKSKEMENPFSRRVMALFVMAAQKQGIEAKLSMT